MKKLFSLLMACCMLAGLLTAVHTSSAAPTRAVQESAAAQVTQVALLEPSRAGESTLTQAAAPGPSAEDTETAPLAVNTGLLAAAAVLTLWALRRRLF